MRLLVLVLVCATLACNSPQIAKLEKENAELRAKLDAISQNVPIELQEKCAKEAANLEYVLFRSATLVARNHYKSSNGHCYVHFTVTHDQGKDFYYKTVRDVFEKTKQGRYLRDRLDKDTGPMCNFIDPQGELKTCKTEEEFDAGVKFYMEK